MKVTVRCPEALNSVDAEFEVYYMPGKNKVALQVQDRSKTFNIIIEVGEEKANMLSHYFYHKKRQIKRKKTLSKS